MLKSKQWKIIGLIILSNSIILSCSVFGPLKTLPLSKIVGVVRDNKGNAIAKATVKIGEKSTVTDGFGGYELNEVDSKESFLTVITENESKIETLNLPMAKAKGF